MQFIDKMGVTTSVFVLQARREIYKNIGLFSRGCRIAMATEIHWMNDHNFHCIDPEMTEQFLLPIPRKNKRKCVEDRIHQNIDDWT